MNRPELIREYSVLEALDVSVHLVRAHANVLLPLAFILVSVPSVLAEWAMPSDLEDNALTGWLALALASIPGWLATVGTAHVLYASAGGAPAGLDVALAAALRPGAVLTIALASAGVVGGLMLFVVPGVFLLVVWIFLGPVLALERCGPLAALDRSVRLSAGYRLPMLAIVAASWVVSMLGAAVAALISGEDPAFTAVAGAILAGIASAYVDTVTFVLYVSARCRTEGFDVEHLARQV